MPPVVSIAPDVSPELLAKREELGILHEILGALGSAQMRATDWPKAAKVLTYVSSKIDALQVEADALSPSEPKKLSELQQILADRAAREEESEDAN